MSASDPFRKKLAALSKGWRTEGERLKREARRKRVMNPDRADSYGSALVFAADQLDAALAAEAP